ncbi:hypothetical protein [Streptomyces sp. NPDC008317]|uniref:hypothetical protein n=1 Tax=Streptomyces sp. NPDC008317 TaxID=3364827 RepID=UPI0036EF76C8
MRTAVGRRSGQPSLSLVEWHSMSVAERDTAWTELRGWVTWLYDRYELSVESRLPDCWAEHPGLIEELWALMLWRQEIYSAEQPSGQAARYWHTELRTVIASAASHYAASCRTGHVPPGDLASQSPELQARWARADPWARIPPSTLVAGAGAPSSVDQLDADAMERAISVGEARPLSPSISEYVRYEGAWWLAERSGGWAMVTTPTFAAQLDLAADRLGAAQDATVRARLTSDQELAHADEQDTRDTP